MTSPCSHITGGSGALARQAAQLYPGSEVTVFETPDVAATARAHFRPTSEEEEGAGPRVRFLSGVCVGRCMQVSGAGLGVWAGLGG